MPDNDILPLAGDFPPADERRWRALADKALKGGDFERELVSRTLDGLRIEPLYGRNAESPGFRAASAEAPWDIRQICAATDAEAANAAMLDDLRGGATSIALRVAAPEQTGLRLQSADDLARALKGVHLDAAGVWIEAGVDFAAAADMLQAVWKARKVSGDKARGGFDADPLGSLARAGGLPVSLEQAMGAAVALAKRAQASYPNVSALLADARPYHDGGATEAQELACLCATAVAYLRACESEGMSPADALPRIAFALAADADLFLTVAKLRAARALIARLAEVAGAARAPSPVRLGVTTSQRMMARRDPYTNILRATIACAGAALGGADAIAVLPFTWALGEPDAFARRIARNIQLILLEESSLGRVADPAGGSWAIEKLTGDLARKAWELFQGIEARGGMAQALAEGAVQAMIRESAEARLRAVALGEEKLTGITSFPHLEETPLDAEPWPLPEELDAAVTVEPVPVRRPAEPFEQLRDAADAYLARHGARPKVFLAALGAPAGFSGPATYAAGLFAAGGIEPVLPEPLTSAGATAAAFKTSGARIACLCGDGDAYATLAAEAAKALKAAGAKLMYLVGRPGGGRAALKAAGVGAFLHQGCDMLEILRETHGFLGVARD